MSKANCSAYSYNIKCQKCLGMGLNGFIFKNKNFIFPNPKKKLKEGI